MCSAGDNAALPALGFPIRASTGQWLFSASPWLIAAVHALLRLLVPRHPPCALTILTVIRSDRPGPLPRELAAPGGPGDTRLSRRLSMAAHVASVQFSRTVERLLRRPTPRHVRASSTTRAARTGGRR